MSIVMLAIVFVGFGPTLFLRAFVNVPELPPYLFVHGAVLTSWYAWSVVQTSCIAAKRQNLHRRLGLVGAALGAVAVVVSAMTTLRFGPRLVARGVDVEARLHFLSEIVWLNINSLICFSMFLSAAIVLRHRSQIHKRLMLLASIGFISAAITRIIDWPIWGMGNNAYFSLFCFVVVLLVAMGLHDFASQRSVHPVTLAGRCRPRVRCTAASTTCESWSPGRR
jgi:hypothetical protein